MAKLTFFLLTLVHLSSVHSLPAGGEAKRDADIVIAREITLTDVSVTTSYSTAITSLQSASPTGDPSNSGVRFDLASIIARPMRMWETNYQ
jgi:endo-1,3(4)-beta-glucanase